MSSEPRTPPNTLAITADGPLVLRGRLRAPGATAPAAESSEKALCRCGGSGNKPWCDGSHKRIGFVDAGRCANPPQSSAHAPEGEIALDPIANGPLRLDGWFELQTTDGKRYVCGDKTWLCRCGASANKPFCDGTHKKTGFST